MFEEYEDIVQFNISVFYIELTYHSDGFVISYTLDKFERITLMHVLMIVCSIYNKPFYNFNFTRTEYWLKWFGLI